MQQRGTRLAILCLLLVAGAAAGFSVWSAEKYAHQLDEQREIKVSTIDRLLSSISAIAAAQQAYADYGRRDVASFTRVSLLVDRITTDAAGLRASTGSTASSDRLEEFWTSLSALMGAEGRAREHLASGDDSGAADAILASAREHVSVLSSSLGAFREAEIENYRAAGQTAAWRERASLVTGAVLWIVGLVAFAVVPRRQRDSGAASPSLAEVLREPEPEPASPAATQPVAAIDLGAAAALSTDLSQLSDQASLPGVLARAAEVLGARGIIIWMGAGAELFAVAAHGYDDAMLRRIKPIPRDADNATAAAWRTGTAQRVAADTTGYGAIVAPLLAPAGCVGVLAVEADSRREADDTTRAVATIVASQLASVLAAWPTASTTERRDSSLNRKAAAS